jgi:hypothetical protein
MTSANSNARIPELDDLRGIAIGTILLETCAPHNSDTASL